MFFFQYKISEYEFTHSIFIQHCAKEGCTSELSNHHVVFCQILRFLETPFPTEESRQDYVCIASEQHSIKELSIHRLLSAWLVGFESIFRRIKLPVVFKYYVVLLHNKSN